MPLSHAYERTYDRMLGEVAAAATDLAVPLVPFWPLRGAAYDHELLVIGRSVNGWVDDWTAERLRDPEVRRQAVAWLRADAEPTDADRMSWITDQWGAATGYNTRRSAFWRVVRRISSGEVAPADWPARLAWTNLYKVSPGAGWNPGANLQIAQRASALELLALELDELAPRRVLALTGTWIASFVDGLGLALEPRSGLVEGVGRDRARPWVVAKHPMGKPGDSFVADVRGAFSELGAPISG